MIEEIENPEDEILAAADDAARDFAQEEERSPEDVIEALVEENQALISEKDELKDQMLRVAADMENLRRRTGRDVADARQFAISNFARDILTVGDNLDRALTSVSEEQRAKADAELAALLEGLDMTGRELVRVLAKHGVTKEEPEGEKFDPNRHQAMFEVPNPEVPTGTVVQVVQAGYMLGERPLRPAMVGVARGGPKMAAQAESSEPQEDDASEVNQ